MTEDKCDHEWLLVSESSTTVIAFPPGSPTKTASSFLPVPPVTTTTKMYKCTKCGKLFQ